MFDRADLGQLAALGISAEDAWRQMRLFAAPPPPAAIDRPCTVGDGIAVLDPPAREAALAAAARAAAAGRVAAFLPASGAATRMFQSLLAARGGEGGVAERAALERRAAAGDAAAGEVLAFAGNLHRFAFAGALAGEVTRCGGDLEARLAAGDLAPVLAALLDANGLQYAALPKALILFHAYPDGARTAFAEQLCEAAATGASAEGLVRMHLTVSPEHLDRFRAVLDEIGPQCEARAGVRIEVGFSTQHPSTDTLAAGLDNQPFRNLDGGLLLRPGGHGALIENLAELGGDLVFIKTIDNVQPEHLREPAMLWRRLLVGHLALLQEELFAHIERLSRGPAAADLAAACRFGNARLGLALADDADAAATVAALDRPLRVCGMVRNTGEPGGGPFWVRGGDGRTTAQIVESAQVDHGDPAQHARFVAATHFNPVFMACAVRDWRGRAFDLHSFVDSSAVFISRKSKDGRALKALERPGLWNGAMARWHTLFVEMPDAAFTPVKTVNDLLRPAHQPPPSASGAGRG